MVRLHCLILISLFSEFHGDSVLADQSTESISAIIQSYADAFTTVASEETQYDTTTQIYPKIEVQGYVNDFTKAKYDEKTSFPGLPLTIAASNPKYTSYKDSSSASLEESNESNESKEPAGPADHVIPFSEHENPKEPSTRPNYTAPGDWAKPPSGRNIPLDFVPTKFLAQVRDSHTVKHIPREYAAESAETSEEKENAARLKEVVKESKANTIYTEEGYEDAAYDHAGHIRDANFQEDFARKLSEELERKNLHPGKKKRPKTYKNRKPRKLNDKNSDKFTKNIKNHSDGVKRVQSSKQHMSSENLQTLKSALKQPVIDPKFAVESGISDLETDLKNEYRETQRSSTDSYVHITTTVPTTFKPAATESAFQSKMDLESTTMRRNVFTIRPKKPVITAVPKHHRNKPKRPLKAFSVPTHIDNYNAFSTSSYAFEPTQVPTTVDYGNVVWGYLLQNPNATYTTTQQTVNPLAVATLNGHGPYLVVVTNPPEAFVSSPSESQNLVSTAGHSADNEYNVTQPIVVASSPLVPVNRKVNHENYNSDAQAVYENSEISNPARYRKGQTKLREKNSKSNKLKSQNLSQGDPNLIEKDKDTYVKYYTAMQAKRPLYEMYDSRKLLEGNGSDGIKRPLIQPKKKKGTPPVTKLLPPAPLSASEYATFHRQNIGNKPIPPSLMEMMPIIDAIHKHEYQQSSFPFLFRRKRSTFGFFRSPNFKPRERRHKEVESIENLSKSSSDPIIINSTKYPSNFHSLLNESPQVAKKEVDAEIRRRFKNTTKNLSDGSSSQSLEELAKFTLDKNSKVSSDNTEDKVVEVQVPELDFANVFEKDEIEPATEKSRVNTKKYPFYKDSSVLRNTALNYIVNPKEVPKKTLGGMEFYDSRVRECEEVNPNLEKIVPDDEEIVNKRGPQEKKLRLRGLGDKIDCYKAKYFDETPFDNPLFLEKEVEMPSPPIELNPKEFASRILKMSAEKEDYTILQGPKSPEFVNVKRIGQLRRPSRHHIFEANLRHYLHSKSRKPNLVDTNQQRYRYPPKNPVSVENQMRPSELRPKMKIKASNSKVVPRYQHLVYEDVMGNIMNLDKSKSSRVPKRGITAKHYKRDNNNRQQEITGSKKLKSVTIDGLVPPPQKIADKLVNSRHRYNFTGVLTKNLRIFKRSIPLNNNQNLSSKGTAYSVVKNDNSTFRIVFTTPTPRNFSSVKQTIDLNEVNVTAAQNISHNVDASPKHLNRSDADRGRYGKFLTNEYINLSLITRRKEPKYNVIKKKSSHNGSPKFHEDATLVSSTLIPVMVRLYDNFTGRIPRGSNNHQAKQQVTGNPNRNTSTDKSKVQDDELEQALEQEDPKKQFVVFEPVQHTNKNKTKDAAITTISSTPTIRDHRELVEFLKGNPPGYDEAFTEETEPTEYKKKELYKVKDDNSDVKELSKNEDINNENLETQEPSPNNEETEDENFESETEDPELEEQKKDVYGEETADDDESEQAEENKESDDDEDNSSSSDEQEDKPFVRFSSRPQSPSENYEDVRYADLGPRVNKPYFYHPPFDVPTYEKYGLDKPVDHSGDDYGHDESEYRDKYVFPWENDNEDDKNKEEDYSESNHHEFPWEKRERREKERQKREKMHKKYDKKSVDNPKYDTDSHVKASGMKFVYTPAKNKYLRNKKDVNALQSNSENHASKFSSKYKSENIKDAKVDNKKSDDTEESVLKNIENTEITTVKDESTNTTPIKNKKNLFSEHIGSDAEKKSTELVMHSNAQAKHERAGRIISKAASSMNRARGRTRRININNGNHNDNDTVQSDVTNLPKIEPILSSRVTHQRGRNRHSTIILSTTTTAKPNIRRRTRLTSTSTTIRTAPKSVHEKRRRQFRVSNVQSTTPPTILTSTSRTVEKEHRSRISKEMIITKTVEDSDDDDQDEDSDKNASRQANRKSFPKVAEISRSRSRHRPQSKSTPDGENPSKKERVEKVTITMEETPDHVYETKEIDKDGVKGKFVTITANNNSDKAVPAKRSRDRTANADDDAEMEEMERRMEAFKSFDSIIQDTEDSADEPSSLRTAEKYVVGSLLQKLPLPLTRKLTGENENNTTENNKHENEAEDEDESEDDDEDVDDDEEEVDENDDEESSSEESTDKKIDEETNRNVTREKNPSVIKDPNNRNYYYVETP